MQEADFWTQVEDLLNRALLQSLSSRRQFLGAIREEAVKREVESLLAAADEDASGLTLEKVIGAAAFEASKQAKIVSRVGSPSDIPQEKTELDLAAPDFLGSPRFQVIRQLGVGGMGVVFEALDRQTNLGVAIKVLSCRNPEALYLFKREFRSLAELVHPNLVSLYELFAEGDHWFFTMELVECAHSFLETVWAQPSSFVSADTSKTPAENQMSGSGSYRVQKLPISLDYGRLRTLFAELAGAVNVLHRSNKVHCDLKPSNVLVRNTGEVVLLDFGLVQPLLAGNLAGARVHDGFFGTPAYAAPEQLTACPLTKAMDWYAFGVMLFEALTGERPYPGPRSKVFRSFNTCASRSPGERNTTTPKDLDQLCIDLLDPDPNKRPQFPQILAGLGVLGTPHSAVTVEMKENLFLGRELQMSRLQEAFAALRNGKPVVACVHGASGSGKSTLVDNFLTRIKQESNVLILAGQCLEKEAVPYKAVDALIDALSTHLRQLPHSASRSMLPNDLPALTRLFPVLKMVFAQESSGDSSYLRVRAIEALRTIFIPICRLQPLVLYIDDLHWGDADSAALLSGVLAQPGAPPLLLIATHQNQATDNICIRAVSDQSREDVLLFDIVVDPLSNDEAERLAELLIGEGHASIYSLIATQSGGNPQLLRELAEQVSYRLLIERVQKLDVGARHLLELLAVSGRHLPLQEP